MKEQNARIEVNKGKYNRIPRIHKRNQKSRHLNHQNAFQETEPSRNFHQAYSNSMSSRGKFHKMKSTEGDEQE